MKRPLSIILAILLALSSILVVGCRDDSAPIGLNTDFKKPTDLGDGKGERVKVILLLGQSNATGSSETEVLAGIADRVVHCHAKDIDKQGNCVA